MGEGEREGEIAREGEMREREGREERGREGDKERRRERANVLVCGNGGTCVVQLSFLRVV